MGEKTSRLSSMLSDIDVRDNELENAIKHHYEKSSVISTLKVLEPTLADTVVDAVAKSGASIISDIFNIFVTYHIDSKENTPIQMAVLTAVANTYGLTYNSEEELYTKVSKLISENANAMNLLVSKINEFKPSDSQQN